MDKRTLAVALGLAVAGGAMWALREVPVAFGGKAAGERAERTHRSPQFFRGASAIPCRRRWTTFVLAMHPWSEPADRLWREAKAHDISLAVPRPGERVNVDDPPPVDGWWQALG